MAIALVGRPNVGKSSLFNRFIGRRSSLVWNKPGVTRDLLKGVWESELGPREIWDLAGWGKDGRSVQHLNEQMLSEVAQFILVVDGSEPLTSEDHECFRYIRTLHKPIVIAVNKADKKTFKDHSFEIYESFQADVFFVSVETGSGLLELETFILEQEKTKAAEQPSLSPAPQETVLILGRPNVGKSSLLNALAGKEISWTSEKAGTTRDTLDYSISHKGVEWNFTDSAGVRKKANVYGRKADPVEIFSVEKAFHALEKSDFCVLVIEAHEEAALHAQDRKLLNLIRRSMTPTLILVNKWDLVRKTWSESKYRNELRDHLRDLDFVPILFVSAKTQFHLPKIFQLLKALKDRQATLSTPRLNRWLQNTLAKKPPRVAKRGRDTPRGRTATQYVKIHYMTQTSKKPMAFQLFCNAPHAVAEDDRRFLENQLRAHFLLSGLPIRLVFRKKSSQSFTPPPKTSKNS